MAVTVSVNVKAIENKLNNLIHDDETMLAVHQAFARYCDDYVPAATGTMAQTVEIDKELKSNDDSQTLADAIKVSKDYVHYTQPYAHYQYTGEIYGPNIPFTDEDGLVYWRSPKGKKKYPTGRPITYSKQEHPKASKDGIKQ